jgi:leucyl-tRNA synthetase
MSNKQKYDHKKIESKWQKYWKDNKTFKVDVDPSKPKYYVLDMFPYPSGSGLHVGHVVGYTATDILARYKRQRGFNVLHPMGWDSFGLPAEQYAIRTGTHPAVTTKINIDTFRRQLQSLGFSYDWDREIATSDSSYYKWTQWIFTKLYEKGLAYEAELDVNFCPALGTVLANEEVDNDGLSKVGGYPVEKRPLRQWVLKITAYAERLIDDLALVDWPESLKKLQINWIGKSIGALVNFSVVGKDAILQVYTTRHDTIFGSTFLVLAPEHPYVEKITTKEQLNQVKEYQKRSSQETEADRTNAAKEKTGVFTGAYVVNPATGKNIPVWIADYVLTGYGTGAVMGVPCHDERDYEFAKKYKLEVLPVLDPDLQNYPDLIPSGMSHDELRQQVLSGRFWAGEGSYINSSNSDVSLNGIENVEEAKAKILAWLKKKGFGEVSVQYKLRDWLFSRQRYWGEPFPILHFADGSKRILALDELPLCPPQIDDYKPSADGTSPLAKVSEWVDIVDPKTGKNAKREINTMPQWAGSCWYYLRFVDPHNEKSAWGTKEENYWMPVDMYVGGVEHAVLHLLYARFWHKVLYDCGLVHTLEPFKTLRNQGLVVSRSYQKTNGAYLEAHEVEERDGKYYLKATGEELISQIDKMSKSKLNGVTPDDIMDEFGTDSLRLYEMFMGPLEKEKVWNTDAVGGCRRFLNRFYDLVTSEKVSDAESEEALKLGHKTVHGVTKDIEALQFNTAIAKMMEFVNEFSKLNSYPRSVLKMVVQALSPFAPHIAEEMWRILGGAGELSFLPYPKINESYLQESVITYVIQINGKVRARLDLPVDQSKEVIFERASKNPAVMKYLQEGTVEKVVFVPNKLLSIVLR